MPTKRLTMRKIREILRLKFDCSVLRDVHKFISLFMTVLRTVLRDVHKFISLFIISSRLKLWLTSQESEIRCQRSEVGSKNPTLNFFWRKLFVSPLPFLTNSENLSVCSRLCIDARSKGRSLVYKFIHNICMFKIAGFRDRGPEIGRKNPTLNFFCLSSSVKSCFMVSIM